jgi:GNAT superfamily N-acetyltransferase
MEIRKAEQTDIQQLIDFQLAMALETEQIKLDRTTLEKGVSAVFEDRSRGQYYVAIYKNYLIASLLITYEWSDWRNGTVLWIQSVYVLPEFRRQGVYKLMYSHIQNKVNSDSSLFGIRLYADIANIIAHKAYLKLGMNDHHYKTFEWMKPR